MNALPRLWLLLCALLTACASAPAPFETLPPVDGTTSGCEGSELSPAELLAAEEDFWVCDDADAQQCFVLECGAQSCTLTRSEEAEFGKVVPTRGVGTVPNPEAALRYWVGTLIRSPLGKPVFIIPWKHHKPLLPARS